MDIEQFVKERALLEGKIRDKVSLLVSEFELVTGLSPDSISIDMEDVTQFSDERRKYIVGNCHVSVEL